MPSPKSNLPRVIFGMGTGRCGTWTLHRILAEQKDTVGNHEGFACPWEPDYAIFYEAIIGMMIRLRASVIFNVGWYWINYTGRIINLFEDPKIVVLKRPREEVVDSFKRYLPDVNKWTAPWSMYWKPAKYCITPDRAQWPEIDAPRTRALEKYWDMYYAAAEFWQRRAPNNLLIVDMHEALNTEAGQRHMLSFLGYPEEDQRIFLNQKLNTPKTPKGRILADESNQP